MEEHSAGVIVYRQRRRREYLVLQYEAGHWDFPKGKIEPGEGVREAAIRELEEETGIRDVEWKAFEEKMEYVYQRGKEKVYKEVVYFLGQVGKAKVTLSSEHTDFRWLPLEDAIARVTFRNAKEMLKKASERLYTE